MTTLLIDDILLVTNQKERIIMQYEKAIKHLKKISNDKGNYNEILKGIYHSGSQLIATDGKRLAQVEVENGAFEEQVLDVKNNKTLDAQFPKVERLFIKEDEVDIELHITHEQVVQLKNILTCIKALKLEAVEIYKEEGAWYIQPNIIQQSDIKQEDLNLRFRLSQSTDKDKVEKKTIDVNYFKHMVEFIKETKEDTKLIMNNNPYKPIQFENESYSNIAFKGLICPIRTF